MSHLLAAVLNTDLYLWPWGQAPRKNVAETSPGVVQSLIILYKEKTPIRVL